MKQKKFNISPRYQVVFFIIGLMLGNLQCIEEYAPNLNVNVDLLTINGSIVLGREQQSIVISRSTPIDSTGYIPVENCNVYVTDVKNNIFRFQETSKGKYTAIIDSSYLLVGSKFKLTVETPDNNIYESGYEEILPCQPIDSLNFVEETNHSSDYNRKENGLRLYVNLQNKVGYSEYYRWLIDETWEYRSAYKDVNKKLIKILRFETELSDSEIILVVTPIYENWDKTDSLHYCWRDSSVNGLYSASTLNLAQNGRKKIPLHHVYASDERLHVRYCCTVRQFSLSEGAYQYWHNKQVEIQESGGIYFSQPGQSVSNIKNRDNDQEAVLGYFWAASVREKRIFFNGPFKPWARTEPCPTDTFDPYDYVSPEPHDPPLYYQVIENFDSPIYIFYKNLENGDILEVTSNEECFDCRKEGGTIKRPDFW